MKKTLLAGYFIISFKLVVIPEVYIAILSRIILDSVDTYIRVCVGCYVSQAVCGGSGHRAAQWVCAQTTG